MICDHEAGFDVRGVIEQAPCGAMRARIRIECVTCHTRLRFSGAEAEIADHGHTLRIPVAYAVPVPKGVA